MNELMNKGLFLLSTAGCVGVVAWMVAGILLRADDRKISDRLANNTSGPSGAVRAGGEKKKESLLKRLGEAASSPFMSDKQERITGMRKKLAMAGIYDPNAIRTLTGFKFILLVGGLLVGYLLGMAIDQAVLGVAMGGLIGYLGPQIWLSMKIKENQKSINLGLPDALDLMVICVESGLTIDASMQRVGDELSLAHPVVSREFNIAHTETRLGVPRGDAFRNLATRTGNVALQALTAMLIQADKFGTSIGVALRVQAEAIRVKRQFAAEEMAAKASVKMSFPLVLFVFPATFVVIGGPMAIELMNSGFMN